MPRPGFFLPRGGGVGPGRDSALRRRRPPCLSTIRHGRTTAAGQQRIEDAAGECRMVILVDVFREPDHADHPVPASAVSTAAQPPRDNFSLTHFQRHDDVTKRNGQREPVDLNGCAIQRCSDGLMRSTDWPRTPACTTVPRASWTIVIHLGDVDHRGTNTAPSARWLATSPKLLARRSRSPSRSRAGTRSG